MNEKKVLMKAGKVKLISRDNERKHQSIKQMLKVNPH